MSRVIITDRFRRLREELQEVNRTMASAPVRNVTSENKLILLPPLKEKLDIAASGENSQRGSERTLILPEIKSEYKKSLGTNPYLTKKIGQASHLKLDISPTQKLDFPNLMAAETWCVNAKKTLLSPSSMKRNDRMVESSINGLAALDELMIKKYNRLVYEENELDRLCELHLRNLKRHEEVAKATEEKYKEQLKVKYLPLSKLDRLEAMEGTSEVNDILCKKTKYNFRRDLRLKEYQKQHYGGLWKKYSDFKI